jgi:hypothetical protein
MRGDPWLPAGLPPVRVHCGSKKRRARSLFAALPLALLACHREEPPDRGEILTEITARAGIPEPSIPWPDGRYQIPEITASGVALFDPDRDGDLDIYLVCHPPPDHPEAPAPNRLFRQESPGHFVELPDAAGLDDKGYGNGAAIGDVDNDGDPDVYVCNLLKDALYLNKGDGTFADGTARSGIDESGWTTGAAFLDYDRDGNLDLYVVHYLLDDPARVCMPSRGEARDYCGPVRYQSVLDKLYQNQGDGTFLDAGQRAGIVPARAGLAVICFDITGDGWPDIYVANDKQPNQLYVNQRDGTFVDEALGRGVALNGSGDPEASMGVGLGDVNLDGELDLFVTSLAGETSTLYLNSGNAAFSDRSASSGLGGSTLDFTGWGCGLVDLDNDGDLDLAVANGRIARGRLHPDARLGPFWNDYAEPSQLFLNQGGGKFLDAARRGGRFSSLPECRRSIAFGDLDGDGDVDLVTADIANRLRIFQNEAPAAGCHWLRVRALTGKRDALGALVTVDAGGVRRRRPLLSAYGYAGASEAVAHFGLGGASKVSLLEVTWPSGRTERFPCESVDRLVTIREGEGLPVGK